VEAKAKEQKAENELKAFKEDENKGKWLDELRTKLWSGTITEWDWRSWRQMRRSWRIGRRSI
jgi:hypothetical protein